MRVNTGGKWHDMTHKWQTVTDRSSSHLVYASNGGFETLHKQWMYSLVGQHPLFYIERVPQLWYFCAQFESMLRYKMAQ